MKRALLACLMTLQACRSTVTAPKPVRNDSLGTIDEERLAAWSLSCPNGHIRGGGHTLTLTCGTMLEANLAEIEYDAKTSCVSSIDVSATTQRALRERFEQVVAPVLPAAVSKVLEPTLAFTPDVPTRDEIAQDEFRIGNNVTGTHFLYRPGSVFSMSWWTHHRCPVPMSSPRGASTLGYLAPSTILGWVRSCPVGLIAESAKGEWTIACTERVVPRVGWELTVDRDQWVRSVMIYGADESDRRARSRAFIESNIRPEFRDAFEKSSLGEDGDAVMVPPPMPTVVRLRPRDPTTHAQGWELKAFWYSGS